jgi:MinD-like ATPase involved in chromosome partitioning or flagellar assembly
MIHKIAFIGPSMIHEALKALNAAWDLQIPVETVSQFRAHLEIEDNPEISLDTKMVILFSRLFKQNPQEFADIICTLAEDAVVCILIPIAEHDDKTFIDTEIEKTRQRNLQQYSDYNVNSPYFYVDYENVQTDIAEAILQFSRNPNVSPDAKNEIQTMLPEQGYMEEVRTTTYDGVDDDEDDFDSDGPQKEFVLPSASEFATGQVIAITSSKGGSGKSTVSIVLGAYIGKGSQIAVEQGLEQNRLKVCIIDLDVRDGQLQQLNGVRSDAPNIFDIFNAYKGKELTAEMIREGIYSSEKLGVDFIFALQKPRFANNIGAPFYAHVIQKLREMYDIIILDTSVNYLDPLLEKVAYPLSDKIICVSDMGVSSVIGMARWIRETTTPKNQDGSGISENKIGVVINKAMNDVNMGLDKIEKAASGRPILGILPSVPKFVTYAANTASLELILTQEQINKAFRLLAETVLEDFDYKLGTVPYDK